MVGKDNKRLQKQLRELDDCLRSALACLGTGDKNNAFTAIMLAREQLAQLREWVLADPVERSPDTLRRQLVDFAQRLQAQSGHPDYGRMNRGSPRVEAMVDVGRELLRALGETVSVNPTSLPQVDRQLASAQELAAAPLCNELADWLARFREQVADCRAPLYFVPRTISPDMVIWRVGNRELIVSVRVEDKGSPPSGKPRIRARVEVHRMWYGARGGQSRISEGEEVLLRAWSWLCTGAKFNASNSEEGT